MTASSSVVKLTARTALKNNWLKAIAACMSVISVFIIISGIASLVSFVGRVYLRGCSRLFAAFAALPRAHKIFLAAALRCGRQPALGILLFLGQGRISPRNAYYNRALPAAGVLRYNSLYSRTYSRYIRRSQNLRSA